MRCSVTHPLLERQPQLDVRVCRPEIDRKVYKRVEDSEARGDVHGEEELLRHRWNFHSAHVLVGLVYRPRIMLSN